MEKGQTLWGIAQVYGVDVERLAKANALRDPDQLHVGQRLWVPQGKEREFLGGKGDFRWPVRGEIVRRFEVDLKAGKRHQGIDVAAPLGSPVVASSSGQVVFSGEGPGKYGKTVIIGHHNGFATVYAYNQENLVVKDQTVVQGEAIARVGGREGLSSPALHFEIRKDAVPYNPLRFLSSNDIPPPEAAPKVREGLP